MNKSDAIIAFQGIHKRFSATHALKDVSFKVPRGTVHALVGENGAGKSTLMNISSGVFAPDSGRVIFDGNTVHIASPRKAAMLGIGMIHQELAGLEELDIAQNILLGHEPRTRSALFIDYPKMHQIATRYMNRLHMDIPVTTKLKELTIGQRQMIEIGKALSLNARLLIMDEPTSALSHTEITHLFTVVQNLKQDNITVLYISHRLEEIFRICDAITVLRDGCCVGTVPIEQADSKMVVQMMIGKDLDVTRRTKSTHISSVLLKVDALSSANQFRNISLSIRKGEVFGLFGLLGSGRSELAHALYGLTPAESGTICIEGNTVTINSVQTAHAYGITYVPEDRKRQGLFPNQTVKRNIIAAIIRTLARFLWIPNKKTNHTVRQLKERLAVRTENTNTLITNLSGGNQQKVILARWLATNPKLLILDEPTRGIDVHAKAQIYTLIDTLAAKGMSILLISSELPEIFRVSNTIGVLRNGELVMQSPYEDTSVEAVMKCAIGEEHNG